ncbi:hypothetical protein SDC9_77022 [bioreactor metagenome]|uniref:Uncharacterized protein n=1 Tax=bioreactor metagenome TaxID=1076179 RepID=A0A644YPC0_9ZZZZ
MNRRKLKLYPLYVVRFAILERGNIDDFFKAHAEVVGRKEAAFFRDSTHVQLRMLEQVHRFCNLFIQNVFTERHAGVAVELTAEVRGGEEECFGGFLRRAG